MLGSILGRSRGLLPVFPTQRSPHIILVTWVFTMNDKAGNRDRLDSLE